MRLKLRYGLGARRVYLAVLLRYINFRARLPGPVHNPAELFDLWIFLVDLCFARNSIDVVFAFGHQGDRAAIKRNNCGDLVNHDGQHAVEIQRRDNFAAGVQKRAQLFDFAFRFMTLSIAYRASGLSGDFRE